MFRTGLKGIVNSLNNITASLLLIFILNTAASAERGGPDIVRDLIIQLNKDYLYLDEALQTLEDNTKEPPVTTLNISVTKRDKDNSFSLVSIEVIGESNRLLKSHIYTSLENEALEAGGRHQLWREEFKNGDYILHVIYLWKKNGSPPQKEDISIPVSVKVGKEYFIELSLEKRENKLEMRYHKLDFSNK